MKKKGTKNKKEGAMSKLLKGVLIGIGYAVVYMISIGCTLYFIRL